MGGLSRKHTMTRKLAEKSQLGKKFQVHTWLPLHNFWQKTQETWQV
jgi:hypothetical protein